MGRVLQIRRGTTAQNDNFTGLSGEVSFDTDAKTLRVHDGVKLGGYALARADQVTGPAGDAFDINSVSDEFWAAKFAQFAPVAFSVVTGNAVPLHTATYIDYIFNIDQDPIMAHVWLVCQTPDAGYSIGDQVHAYGFGARCAPAPNVFRDALGLHVRMMIGNQTPWVCHRDTGAVTNTTDGRWQIQYRLYY